MREALTLVSHKAAQERHRNEAEEDDEEDGPTDHTLGLRAAKGKQKHGEAKSDKRATIDWWLTFPFCLFCLDLFRTVWQKWNDLWMQEWASAWPGSRAPTGGRWWPAAGRGPLACLSVWVGMWVRQVKSRFQITWRFPYNRPTNKIWLSKKYIIMILLCKVRLHCCQNLTTL